MSAAVGARIGLPLLQQGYVDGCHGALRFLRDRVRLRARVGVGVWGQGYGDGDGKGEGEGEGESVRVVAPRPTRCSWRWGPRQHR